MPATRRESAVTGAVMAGGKSRRFGQDKAQLSLNGETLLARTLQTLSRVTDDLVVVGPPERRQEAGLARVVSDEYPDSGPLGGIYTALRASSAAAVLVVACDMPFLSEDLLRHLLTLREDFDVVLPRVDGHGEQLHAIYAAACCEPMKRHLDAGDYKIDRVFAEVRVRTVAEDELRRYDPGLRSFWNVNTPEDWERAQTLLLS
jgi:molybdopterin-guanine dinucleotide biosynthesis protein A